MRRLLALAAATLVSCAILTAPAFGAEASQTPTSTSTAPVVQTLGTIDVQWWMEAEPGQAIAIVSTRVDESVQLPIRVRLPIPPGMTVDWAGEISSGDASQDVQREFTVAQGTKASYAEFEISTFRVAQIDLSGRPLATGGGTVAAEFEYVQSVASTQTAFTVRLPAGASDAKISPAPEGSPSTNDAGESLYSLPSAVLAPGESQVTSVEYSPSETGGLPEVGGGMSGTSGLIALLLVLVVVAGVVLAIVVRKQARESRG